MQEKSGVQISQKSFLQSLLILLVLMLAAGLLTRLVPAGEYQRLEMDGREMIDPASFQYVPAPEYPVWRWLTAPLEVLAAPDGLTVIIIIIFLLMVGVSFTVLERSGLLRELLIRLVKKFGGRKYLLLMVISFFFMVLGAFFGIFEEVVPLVPLMIALSYALGWDALVGLGMSILATNLGFSAAITNPFTIGVAQQLAELPLFSGSWLRVIIFAVVYALLILFLTGYARRIERTPQASAVFHADLAARQHYPSELNSTTGEANPRMGRAMLVLGVFLALILLSLVSLPLIPWLSQFSLPLVGILFLAGGLVAAWQAGLTGRALVKVAWQGALGIAPAIPLILMAASVKHIVSSGGILDSLLHQVAEVFTGASPFSGAVLIYFTALFIEFFIGSASAKAFLLMPILIPLADLVGVTRQVAVTAYCFGDGFSNMVYPTNPVLLISLGLTVVSYPRWLRWTLKLWLGILVITLVFLAIAVAIHFGPF